MSATLATSCANDKAFQSKHTSMLAFLFGTTAAADASSSVAAASSSTARLFEPSHELCETDATLIAMLNSAGHEHVAYCVCDPANKDLPIIFASDGFCEFTGYTSDEIQGRNCRFLQGADTERQEVDRIRQAIQDEQAVQVNLLNYRKDGTTFANEFFLSPLKDESNKTVYVS
jgi:PAS domain S-box-containing protein